VSCNFRLPTQQRNQACGEGALKGFKPGSDSFKRELPRRSAEAQEISHFKRPQPHIASISPPSPPRMDTLAHQRVLFLRRHCYIASFSGHKAAYYGITESGQSGANPTDGAGKQGKKRELKAWAALAGLRNTNCSSPPWMDKNSLCPFEYRQPKENGLQCRRQQQRRQAAQA
jgi:hypothetical protein